jgi:hypothetical protein
MGDCRTGRRSSSSRWLHPRLPADAGNVDNRSLAFPFSFAPLASFAVKNLIFLRVLLCPPWLKVWPSFVSFVSFVVHSR